MVEHEKTYKDIPTVALRGLVVLPGEMLHFDAGRPKSVHALNRAMDEEGLIFVSAQKDPKISEIEPDDIYETGTLCALRQVLPMPGDSARVFVEGVCRALAVKVRDDGEGFSADIEMLEDEECKPARAEALRRRVDKKLGEYAQLSPKLNSDIMANIEAKLMPGEFADAAANAVLKRPEQRQEILEELEPAERMKKLLSFFVGEIDILKADRRIAAEVKYQVDKSQKEYYYREQIKAIRKELGESSDTEADEFRAKLEHKQMPDSVRSVIEREIKRYGDLPAGSHEAPSARNYIECMLDLPWNEESTDNMDLAHARETLDSAHYGMDKVKERIIEYMAVARLTGKVNGQVICFVGPPGVGKTSIAKSIADALGRRFVRMSLGGIRDEAEIRGHRRTYIGAMPGRVISAMRQAGVMNPVILFDEIEKAHPDVFNIMLQLFDEGQLTDGLGRKVDFRNTVIIMTSNVGSRRAASRPPVIGYDAPGLCTLEEQNGDGDYRSALEDTFAPEFINRIDDIVVFNTLSLDDVKRIVDIEFGRIAKRAAAMGYTLELSEDAREELAALGFQPRYGARSLRRMLLEYVEEPLAGMIVGEEVCGGDTVSVEFVGGRVALVRRAPAGHPHIA